MHCLLINAQSAKANWREPKSQRTKQPNLKLKTQLRRQDKIISRRDFMLTMHLPCNLPIRPNLEMKTRPEQLLQGILKGEVSLYHWPPVWLVWNQLYDNWQFLFLFAKQTNPNHMSWKYFHCHRLHYLLSFDICLLSLSHNI